MHWLFDICCVLSSASCGAQDAFLASAHVSFHRNTVIEFTPASKLHWQLYDF